MSKQKKMIRVRDVMTNKFAVLDGLATVSEGLQTMKNNDVRALIIDKRHSDDAYGIVLLSDLAKNVLAPSRSPKRVSLYEVMSKPVIWVGPEMDIRYCARLFDNFGLAVAPVLEDGIVIGVVSYHEIVLNGLIEFA